MSPGSVRSRTVSEETGAQKLGQPVPPSRWVDGLGFRVYCWWVEGSGFRVYRDPKSGQNHNPKLLKTAHEASILHTFTNNPNPKTIPNPKKELHWRVQVGLRILGDQPMLVAV